MEAWKDIEGYEGLYQVSSLGRVKGVDRYVKMNDGRTYHVKETILAAKSNNSGYLMAGLNGAEKKKSKTVHRLVAEAFVEKEQGKSEVNHINGNKLDNRAGNLEWVTRKENQQHASRVVNMGKKRVVRSDGTVFASMTEAAEATGVSVSLVSSLCNGYRKKTKEGFSFKKLE